MCNISKGIYNNIRLVMCLKDFCYFQPNTRNAKHAMGLILYIMRVTIDTYNLHVTVMVCIMNRILCQLVDSIRAQLPIILTRQYACDVAVMSLLRSRTLGNSPTVLQNSIHEVHSEQWLKQLLMYLSSCKHHRYVLFLGNWVLVFIH